MTKRPLNESISDNPSINAQIEKLLGKHDAEQQTRILDALDALKMAGPSGLSPVAWATKVNELHPDGGFSMQDLLKTVVSQFKCCVKRIGDKLYAWDDSESEMDGVPPEMAAAVKGQVKLASESLKIMKELGEFTIPQLATSISERTGLPLSDASAFADHLVQQFHGGMITPVGDGKFKVNIEKKKTSDDHIAGLKDLLKNAGLDTDNK